MLAEEAGVPPGVQPRLLERVREVAAELLRPVVGVERDPADRRSPLLRTVTEITLPRAESAIPVENGLPLGVVGNRTSVTVLTVANDTREGRGLAESGGHLHDRQPTLQHALEASQQRRTTQVLRRQCRGQHLRSQQRRSDTVNPVVPLLSVENHVAVAGPAGGRVLRPCGNVTANTSGSNSAAPGAPHDGMTLMPMRRLPTEPLVPLFASCRVLRHALPRNTLHRSARAPHRNAAPIPAHHAFTLCRVTSYRPISESAADPHVCSPQPLAAHADSPRVGPSHAKPPRGNHHELHSCRQRARARVGPLRALALFRSATAPLCTLHSSAAIRLSARTRYRSARTSAGSCPPCLTVPDYQRPRPPPVVSGRPPEAPSPRHGPDTLSMVSHEPLASPESRCASVGRTRRPPDRRHLNPTPTALEVASMAIWMVGYTPSVAMYIYRRNYV